MKPSKRPGKPATAGRASRQIIVRAKPIALALLPKEHYSKKTSKTEGRKGKKKMLNADF